LTGPYKTSHSKYLK